MNLCKSWLYCVQRARASLIYSLRAVLSFNKDYSIIPNSLVVIFSLSGAYVCLIYKPPNTDPGSISSNFMMPILCLLRAVENNKLRKLVMYASE